MRRVFADTFYYLAILNESDRAHERAVALSVSLGASSVTTAWVLTELGDGMASVGQRAAFLRLVDNLKANPLCHIVPASESLFDQGLALYAERPDKDWSLTDCMSFVVMREQRLTEALTGDRHFEQAGFRTLLA